MQNDPSIILQNILDIVNYPHDKHTFIDQFGESCMKKGLAKVVNVLSIDSQLKLAEEISTDLQTEEFEKIIYRYVAPEDYKYAIQEASSILFEDFLKTIESNLTPVQSDKLDIYLASL